MVRALLQFLLLLGLASQANSYLLEGVSTRDGGAAEASGTCGGNICLTHEGNCENGKCKCLYNMKGDGNLACYDKNAYRCCVASDPKVVNFANEHFDLDSPCRTKMVDYSVFFPPQPMAGKNVTLCSVKAHSYGERRRGKVYIGGVDAAFTFNGVEFFYRAFGSVEKTDPLGWQYMYKYQIQGSSDGETWVDLSEADVPFGYGDFTEEDGRVFFHVPDCSFFLIWRPPHPLQGAHQARTPGVCAIVEKSEEAQYVWNGGDTICGAPGGPALGVSQAALGLSNLTETALYWSLKPEVQSPQFLSHQCAPVGDEIKYCKSYNPEGFKRAFKYCTFLLSNEHSVNCLSHYDGTYVGNDILSSYRMCFSTLCLAGPLECADLVQNMMSFGSCNSTKDFNGWELSEQVCAQIFY